MTPQQERQLVEYLRKIAIAADEISKALKKDPIADAANVFDDIINHVGYDREQCGYEK